MPAPLVVPDLGAESQDVRISAWFVEPGDHVAAGEAVLELLTGGVTCEITADTPGRIIKILAPLDALVQPGDIVAWLETAPPDDNPAAQD